MPITLTTLNRRIIACDKCPRLRHYCTHIAATKRKAYADQTYWGKPVPNFLPKSSVEQPLPKPRAEPCLHGEAPDGSPDHNPAIHASLLIVGLAPGAHGANRTGRMFTGDRSGDFLYAALHRAGLASQPTSVHCNDGLALTDTLITAAAHCAPPDNKPTPDELDNCSTWLDQTLALLPDLKVILCLGAIALNAVTRHFQLPKHKFAHAAEYPVPSTQSTLNHITILCSYHVSQQNTFTGRLTPAMFDAILARAKRLMQ